MSHHFRHKALRANMSFSVTVQPGAHQFTVAAGESILAAALHAGIILPYGCKNGACGSCKGTILEGEIAQGAHTTQALSATERARGAALLCCAEARSDLVVQCREVRGAGDIAVRKLPCRVESMTTLAADVKLVRLQLPANERFQYLAGQFIEILLKDGTRRSYSMAAAPTPQTRALELHVRHMPGGVFTDAVFGRVEKPLKVLDILRFEGPFGTFLLRDDDPRPIIFLASGTGFAPIKAMLEQAVERQLSTPMRLYWGGRRPQDLYMAELARAWEAQLPDFRFIPVVSDAWPEDEWQGRTGWVHQAVMEDYPALAGHQVYACGAPPMVDAARRDFTAQCGLSDEAFFADTFTSQADLAQRILEE